MATSNIQQTVTEITNAATDRVLTVNNVSDDQQDLNAEANLTFASSTLTVTGDQTSSASAGAALRLSANDGAAMGDSHRLGVIEFTGAEDASNTQAVGARIEAITDAAWTNAENGCALYFYTTDGNASQTNVLKIDSNQKATFSGEIVADSLDISGNADIDGTLEADAITLNGTALGSLYSPIAGSGSIVTTGALNSGSITSGFGSIAIGTDDISCGDLTASGGDIVLGSSGDADNTTISAVAEAGTDTAGKSLTIKGGASTGNAAGGSIILQTSPAGNASGSSANSLATALTIDSTLLSTFAGDVVIGGTDPKLTIGDAGAEDTMLVFDGNAADYRIGIDDGTDTLEIGKGSAHGTTPVIKIDSSTNCQVMHNSAVADGEYSGDLAMFTAGEDLTAGEVVYLKSDGKLWKAVATAAATSRCVAMCVASVSADAMGPFLLKGFARFNSEFPTWTVGGVLYTPEAETSSKNVPEQTAPDTDGDFVQVIGYAVSADAVYFSPDSTVIEVA